MRHYLYFFLASLVSLSGMAEPIIMKHMPNGKNCIICHEEKKPKILFLRDGTKISPTEVVRQCQQCHGVKYREWNEGSHGKAMTSWRPEKIERMSCTKCHNPHAPKFPEFKSIAPPKPRIKK